ncbi:MAG TPA: RNA-directed DNA polymerase, partial [Thermoanaerobaculia bacterium]|nr:RNA-directed DNA polymerase [Thermoanaerobaculia bacterium]
ALMAHIGPVLERALVADTFACRVGKGTLAAVLRAQANSRRYAWWAKIDIRSYFASIDHEILKGLLVRRFKGNGALALCERVIDSFEASPGRGLPIGALTSQHFANLYLSPLDRFLLERLRLPAMVRYMDDVVGWTQDRARAQDALLASQEWVASQLRLAVKQAWQPQRSERGLTFCGFRVLPTRLELSRRRRIRYRRARSTWEASHALGLLGDLALQAGYASALAITAHAQAAAWRRKQLANWPAPEV